MYLLTYKEKQDGTVLAGLLANLPLVQASGMGLNAFFVYTVCIGFGFTYANALVLVFIEGIFFIILTVTGLRKKIFEVLPEAVKVAIPSGIGLFIALLGLQNAGIVAPNESTCVDPASFNLLTQNWGDIMPMTVTLCTFLAIVIMSQKKIRGAVLFGILGGMGLYYLLGFTVDGFYSQLNINFLSPFEAFESFGKESLFKVFYDGFDFSAFLAERGAANLILTILTTSLAFCMVDMFDTLGTLYAACERAGLVDEKGDPLEMNEGMLSDAIATTTGAICGTSSVTTFSEVNAGVAAGNRSYFGVETDVHTTKDGKFIIIHYETTDRITNDSYKINIEESEYSAVENIVLPDLDGTTDRKDIRIPLLGEYIKICKKYEKLVFLR